jgi:Protein of unknown function (DUF2470)
MPISDDAIAAVLTHMNGDHVDDNQLIARAFGDPAALGSVMTGVDEFGGTWKCTVGGIDTEVRVAWTGPISERAEIRREIVLVYEAACMRLGIRPRIH